MWQHAQGTTLPDPNGNLRASTVPNREEVALSNQRIDAVDDRASTFEFHRVALCEKVIGTREIVTPNAAARSAK
jgi:hypothetical protein